MKKLSKMKFSCKCNQKSMTLERIPIWNNCFRIIRTYSVISRKHLQKIRNLLISEKFLKQNYFKMEVSGISSKFLENYFPISWKNTYHARFFRFSSLFCALISKHIFGTFLNPFQNFSKLFPNFIRFLRDFSIFAVSQNVILNFLNLQKSPKSS